MLRTKVKIGNINNLSDARFAAGIGSDFAGFCFELESPLYVSPAEASELISWIQGPRLVGEFDHQDADEINTYISMLKLDYVQLRLPREKEFHERLNAGIIQGINLEQCSDHLSIAGIIERSSPRTEFFILSLDPETEPDSYLRQGNNAGFISGLCRRYKMLLDFPFSKDNIVSLIDLLNPYGINLHGENEMKPGLRDFDDLIDLVEALELD